MLADNLYNFHIATNTFSSFTIGTYLQKEFPEQFKHVRMVQIGQDNFVISLQLDRATRTAYVQKWQKLAADNIGKMVMQLIQDDD